MTGFIENGLHEHGLVGGGETGLLTEFKGKDRRADADAIAISKFAVGHPVVVDHGAVARTEVAAHEDVARFAEERRAAYACDVTYCTNKEIVFDYLKDRIVLGRNATRIRLVAERLFGGGSRAERLVLRGLCYGIVDEADSVLIDEARTPLIISDRSRDTSERETYEAALELARGLEAGNDFELDERERSVRITEAGRARLEVKGHLGSIG